MAISGDVSQVQQEQDWEAWLRLMLLPGVGNDTARKLLSTFGLPEAIFTADRAQLHHCVSENIARALLAPLGPEIQTQIAGARAWLGQADNHFLHIGHPRYPASLLQIPDPPVILFAKGKLDLLDAPTVAVVGSRNATTQGVLNAEKFSEALSHAGLTISSGLASGIDTAAHQGALRGSGSTVAVIGTGADIVYPARNRALAHQIAEQGCILSEYFLGTPAIPGNFPRRNRIISGLARGVLVVEAAAQSGSLITARMAAEQGRDVFAIPGSIHSPLAKGCHQLIKQGAKLVESAQDILDEISFQQQTLFQKVAAQNAAEIPEGDSVLDNIGYDPVHVDALLARSSENIANLQAKLFHLELQGMIESLPGGLVQRVR